MSVGGGILGSIYSRLPQTNNDFDMSTDEEDLLSHARKFQHYKPSSLNTLDHNPATPAVKMGEYQPLGQDRSSSASVHINGFNNINYDYGPKGQEEDLMMGGGKRGSVSVKGLTPASKVDDILRHPMSAMRRVAFIMSILLCIFTIVAFLWVLPCEWASCPAVQRSARVTSWDKTLLGLEIVGTMTVIPSETGDSSNLLLMVRGQISFPNMASSVRLDSITAEPSFNFPANGGGILSLLGSSGEVDWFRPLPNMPRDIDCSLIDVNSDGLVDCLLVGAETLLMAFNARSGTRLWTVRSLPSSRLPVDIDFPLILPDLNGDGVPELAVSCGLVDNSTASDSEQPVRKVTHNSIALISGKSGKVIGSPYVVADCESVESLSLDRKRLISFTCQDAVAKDSVKTLHLKDLIRNVTQRNPFLDKLDLKSSRPEDAAAARQHHSVLRSSGSPSASASATTVSKSGRRLTLENCGVCPDQCSVSVKVTDERHGRSNETIWIDGGPGMYALAPAVLSFSYASGNVSIFVLKFWHWAESSTSGKDAPTRIRRNEPSDWLADNQTMTNRFLRSADNVDENKKSEKSDPEKNITQRAVPSDSTPGLLVPDRNFLTERIVLLTFNSTDLHPINASQSEIQQFCTEKGCQPSLEFQEHSLLVTDLDHDDSQEVVSYLTTYAPEKETEHTDRNSLTAPGRLQLVSKIRVVRLEAELPKLYEAFTRN